MMNFLELRQRRPFGIAPAITRTEITYEGFVMLVFDRDGARFRKWTWEGICGFMSDESASSGKLGQLPKNSGPRFISFSFREVVLWSNLGRIKKRE